MILDFNITNLLENRYNITNEEYWTLSNKEKDEITKILFDVALLMLANNNLNYKMYLEILTESIEFELFNECYETVEILTKLKNKLQEIFIY
jgi:hypothetical protein